MENERGTCIRIEMEYEDGTIYRAVGDDAEAIQKELANQATIMYLHGMEYKGPQMQKVEK